MLNTDRQEHLKFDVLQLFQLGKESQGNSTLLCSGYATCELENLLRACF